MVNGDGTRTEGQLQLKLLPLTRSIVCTCCSTLLDGTKTLFENCNAGKRCVGIKKIVLGCSKMF